MTGIKTNGQSRVLSIEYLEDMSKKYFVSYYYGYYGIYGSSMFGSTVVEVDNIAQDISAGVLAERLETEVSKTIDAYNVVIINYWEYSNE